uniref:SET domain containing 5 n=1 Tax=Amphiprion percula TaxID=161767 RepID=A0A3P8TIY2_AMPPE
MSIVIALGVTTPETSYSDMAAGSDPESVEASPAVNEKNYNNHSCGSAQSHGYRGLPYAVSSYCSYDNSADSDSSSEEDGAVASWCHCSLTPDGLLIKCDNCRGLDRRKGAEGQHRKAENVSAGESSATESGDEEVSPSTISYTATQHTPTSIKLTVNRVKRSKSKKRKKSTEKARGTPKSKKVKNSTTEANVLDENTAEGWESRIRQWTDQYEEALANQYSADVQTLTQIHISVDAMDTINRTELACNNTVLGSQMQLQLGRVTRVQKHRKILRAAKNLEPDTLIIEYRGKVMLKQQFETEHYIHQYSNVILPFASPLPYPFVLFYSKFNEVEMCVDARTFGNDARFIRRSCTPNAEVRHMIAEGMIHLCIYAVSQITKDTEVTIGFDYDIFSLDCACHKGNQNCPVQKHNLSPRESLLSPPSLPPPSPLVGAETRRRKARRRELEGCLAGDSNQTLDQQQEAKDLPGTSDTEVLHLFDSLYSYIFLQEVPSIEEKTSLPNLPAPVVPPKPARPTKPRPKSRISRYRSSSSQRARRQRQALAQQAAAAAAAAAMAATPTSTDQGVTLDEEDSAEYVKQLTQPPFPNHIYSFMCSANGELINVSVSSQYLVTEWLNDKIPGGRGITTDPTVLATTLNMLPGLSHSSLICTTPRHYVRFGSPFNPESRRPRPLQMDGTYGCYKKCMFLQQHFSPFLIVKIPELNAPFKKRRSKYMTEVTPAPSDHLLRPLSPITPPLPEDSLHPLLHPPSLLPNGLVYSPMPSLPASRCNTPLQFEPCLQTDFDVSRPQFPDLSLPSSLESPVAVTSDDFSLPSGQDSQGPSSVGTSSLNPVSCPSSDLNPQNREQAFRTEFNLIYTCSPLNANLGNPVATDRRLSQSEGGFSPAESFHSSISCQGLVGDVGPGSMSPYGEPHYIGGYPDSGTPPHTNNPPQKKKVSLLEYRKRKQGSGRDPEPAGSSSSLTGTSTRPAPHYSRDSHHPHPHQQKQPPASPHSSFSSSAPTASIPQIEEVSPPEPQGPPVQSRRQDNVTLIYWIHSSCNFKNVSLCQSDCVSLCVQSIDSHRQTDSPSFLQQTSNSPFRGSYSPSSGQSFYPRLSSSHPGLSQDNPPTSYPSPGPTSSSDSRPPTGSLHQQSGSSNVDGGHGYSGSHLKASLLNSGLTGAPAPGSRAHGQTKVDSGAQGSRGSQQQACHGLKSGSPGQAALQAGSRLLSASGPTHYPQRGTSLSQFQHSPLQGPGVRTQSGSF